MSDRKKKSVDKGDNKIKKKEETFPIYQDFMPEAEEADLESKVEKLIAKALAKRSALPAGAAAAAASEESGSGAKKKNKKRKRSPTPSSRSSSASSSSSVDNQEDSEREAEESDNDLKMAKRSGKGKSGRKTTTHKTGKKTGKKSGASSSQKKQISAVTKSLSGIQKKLHKIFHK